MKKGSKKNKWSDHYTRQAKKEKYPARSVYKLEEIQKKYRLIKKGHRVLDLGCSPGSWLIYAAKLVGDKGFVVGIDKKPVSDNMPGNTKIYSGDVFSLDPEMSADIGRGYNTVLSDMAPDTTGNRFVDTARSFDLCRQALEIADTVLARGGSFVCKIFQGEDFNAFSESVKKRFKQHKIFKPKTSRKASREVYVIGMGFITRRQHVRS